MKSSEIKKGTRVLLKNGWYAETTNSLANRATRECRVFGYCEDIGSVYTAEIVSALVDGVWKDVEHTEAHQRVYAMAKRMLG